MSDSQIDNNKKKKKPKRFLRGLIVFFCILAGIVIAWTVFSLIGRVDAGSVIPDSAVMRLSVSNPVRLIDGILTHDIIDEISAVPALAAAVPAINILKENPVLRNHFVRLAVRGKLELALLSAAADTSKGGTFAAAWDMRLLSPILRLIPVVSNFVNVPGLYYVQAGKNSRFEYRLDDMTLFVGPYRNLLFVTDNSDIFEARNHSSPRVFNRIKPSAYDIALLVSPDFIDSLLADQADGIAAIFDYIGFDSAVEAGLSIQPRKLELRLAAPLSSNQIEFKRFLDSRSQAPGLAERLPASTQYATILSAGTLEELFQTAFLLTGNTMDDPLRQADTVSRFLIGVSLSDLLFSWSGKEFAAFGMEGRPHPVYAIQVSDERKRQEVFERAFKSIALGEDVRLHLDGVNIPRIEVPEFLQMLLRQLNINLPSPYYIVYRDFFLASESAESLLSALRSMQRNDVLPRTAVWRNIAGGSGIGAASAFSLYYSLDLSVPFFLRNTTALTDFLSLYRQGLVRMGFDRGLVDLTLSLIPGSGSGVRLVNGYPLDIGSRFSGRVSNRIYGIPGDGAVSSGATSSGYSGVVFTVGNSAVSVNLADNSVHELPGQGAGAGSGAASSGIHVIPATGTTGNAWVVSDRGRVTLVDGNMEPAAGFPILTGHRLSAPPQVFDGKLYLCDDDGKVHIVDTFGSQSVWETSFDAPLLSPPTFFTVPSRGRGSASSGASYAAVYPKSFFGELWLLSADGKTLPDWPVQLASDVSASIGYGSPLLLSHNNRLLVVFITQAGELHVLGENASYVSPFPVFLRGIFYLQPVFDGEFLWLVSSDGNLFRVSLDGEVLYQQIPNFSVMEEGYITIFDYDGNKVPEVFITGEGNALYAYTRHFRSLEGFPLPVWGRPHFISGSSRGGGATSSGAEIIGMGMDRRLYRWQFK